MRCVLLFLVADGGTYSDKILDITLMILNQMNAGAIQRIFTLNISQVLDPPPIVFMKGPELG